MRDINLLESHSRAGKTKVQQYKPYIIAAVTLVFLMIDFYIWNIYRIKSINTEIDGLNSFINKSDNVQKLKEYEDKKNKDEVMTKYLAALQAVNAQMEGRDIISSKLIMDIANIMPSGLFIQTMSADTASLQISGIASDRTSIAEFQHNLLQSGICGEVQVGSIGMENQTGSNYTFSMKCVLKDVK